MQAQIEALGTNNYKARSRSRLLIPSSKLCLQSLQLLLGALFLVAGLSKLINLPGFHESLTNLPFLDGPGAGVLCLLVPNVEITIGACLLLKNPGFGISVAALLLAVCFTAVAAYWMKHGLRNSCGCLGSVHEIPESTVWLLVRNLVLLTLTVTNLYWSKSGIANAGTRES